MTIQGIVQEIELFGSATSAKQCERFFQVGPGQYGYGDKFCDTSVPILRKIAKKVSRHSVQ
jgi:hypothetical protein